MTKETEFTNVVYAWLKFYAMDYDMDELDYLTQEDNKKLDNTFKNVWKYGVTTLHLFFKGYGICLLYYQILRVYNQKKGKIDIKLSRRELELLHLDEIKNLVDFANILEEIEELSNLEFSKKLADKFQDVVLPDFNITSRIPFGLYNIVAHPNYLTNEKHRKEIADFIHDMYTGKHYTGSDPEKKKKGYFINEVLKMYGEEPVF